MELKNLDWGDVFRFLVTGFWFYFIFSFVYEDKLPFNIDNDSIPFLIVILLSIGTMLYFSFRSLVYPLFVRVIDLFVPNARCYIRKKYNIGGWIHANDLWQIYQNNYIDDFKGNYKTWHPSIHMLCICWVQTLAGYIYYSFYGDNPIANKAIILRILFGLFFVSSVASQIMYELRIFSHLRTHDDANLTTLIKKWKSKEEKNA